MTMTKFLATIAALALLAGCATSSQFSTVGEDFKLSKMSGGCAAGSPSAVLEDLRQEALKFCAGRKETPTEVTSTTEIGIPAIRCASASLTFRCKAAP